MLQRILLKGGKVKVAQSFLTFCDPMDYTVLGIFQVRILEWLAVPFSRGSSQPKDRTQVSRIAGGFFTSRVIFPQGREALKFNLQFRKSTSEFDFQGVTTEIPQFSVTGM